MWGGRVRTGYRARIPESGHIPGGDLSGFPLVGQGHRTGHARHARTATDGADLALRLLTESADPVVRPVVERVTRRRPAITEAAFVELGRPAGADDRIADLLTAFGVAR
ncbi:hypothetical protein ABZ079_01925 [Streptomyces sp. NPDC006314]|uniref:hypothetical protein n=1 Tax=Streptomyces sp. NPDC006314 TaxID=3154475 RepID=UPI0033BBEA59